MTPQEALAIIQTRAGVEASLVETEMEASIAVGASDLHALMAFVKDAPELAFSVLASQLGSHTKTAEEEFITLYYVVVNYHRHQHLTISVKLSMDNLIAPTVSDLWPAADWLERETYDLLGVKFSNHPNLKRIMLPEDWVGHPLRKDYVTPTSYFDHEFQMEIDNRLSEISQSFLLK